MMPLDGRDVSLSALSITMAQSLMQQSQHSFPQLD